MAELLGEHLPKSLMRKLQGVQYSLFSTVDHQTGGPAVNAISWIYALNSKRICIAVGHRSRMIDHVKANPAVVVTLIGPNVTYEIAGEAKVKDTLLAEVSIKLACIEVTVNTVKNVMYFGARIIQDVVCEKTYDAEKSEKLDREVMEVLKKM